MFSPEIIWSPAFFLLHPPFLSHPLFILRRFVNSWISDIETIFLLLRAWSNIYLLSCKIDCNPSLWMSCESHSGDWWHLAWSRDKSSYSLFSCLIHHLAMESLSWCSCHLRFVVSAINICWNMKQASVLATELVRLWWWVVSPPLLTISTTPFYMIIVKWCWWNKATDYEQTANAVRHVL